MTRKIRLVDYDSSWREKFEKEAELVTKAFGEILIRIHHIGSTAIPEICAKPIIDILVEVSEIERVEEINQRMMEVGYVAKGEFGIPGRRYFSKGVDDNRTHHVHTFQVGDPNVDRHLDFRNFLRARPEYAQEYCRLKRELVKKYPEDIESYTEGKSKFIKEIEERARDWKRS